MPSEPEPKKISRRTFLRRAVYAGLGGCAVLGAWPFVEARFYKVSRHTIAVPRLPGAFDGMTVALLADIHHGPYWGIDFVRSVVEDANALGADLVLLGGDFVHRDPKYIEPCIAELAKLKAPRGVYYVLGNHDHWEGAVRCRAALGKAEIESLENRGLWLTKDGARLRLGGVGDLWEDTQELDAALGDCRDDETALLLSHNPDYTEDIRDRRVGLVLSGHTHGGQCQFPIIGAPVVPSRYGEKYLEGLVKTDHTQVFVSRGLGTITPPVRFMCRPEIVLITLSGR